MRALAVLLGMVLAAGLVAAIWWLTRSPQPHSPEPGPPVEVARPSGTADQATLPVPETREEAERRAYAQRRAPFLQALAGTLKNLRASCRTADDLGVLEIIVEAGVEPNVELLRDAALEAGAEGMGYRKIVILRSAPKGTGQPPALLAEVTRSPQGRWLTFVR